MTIPADGHSRPTTTSRHDGGSPRDRNRWIEALRIAAAFAIVWYHAKAPGSEAAYAGLTAFLAIGLFYETRRNPARPFEAAALARRILIPWAFWFVVYGLSDWARGKPVLEPSEPAVEAVLYGTNGHLWYLPFILAMQLGLRGLLRSRTRPAVPWLAALLAAALLASVSWWRPLTLGHGPPIAQYAQALVPALFGIVLAEAVVSHLWRIVAALLFVGMLWLAAQPYPELGEPYAVGCALVATAIAAATWPLSPGKLGSAPELMFGVYLVHPLLLGALHPLLRLNAALGVAVAFAGSLLVVWLIRRWGGRPGRAIIGLT